MSEAKYKLEDLIQVLCSSGSNNLDTLILKEIKVLCRDNDEHCKYCYEILITQLKKEHSEVRYSCLQIIDCLFQRSHIFRELLLDEFQSFFELVLETDLENPLPPPAKKAALLKNLAARIIKEWNDKFSDVYKLLDLGFNYLKNCKKVDFVSFSHQSSAQRAHVAKESERQQIFNNKKCLTSMQEIRDTKEDIKNCIGQLERCLDIIKPNDLFENADFELPTSISTKKQSIIDTESIKEDHLRELETESDSDDDDDDDFVEVPVAKNNEDEEIELRYLGFLNDKSSAYTRNFELELKVDSFKIDDENKIVVEIMRDLYKELKNSYMVKVKDWIKNFNQVKLGQSTIKEAIYIKNSVQDALKKFEELRLPEPEIIKENNEDKPKVNNFQIEENSEDHPGTSRSKVCSNDLEKKMNLSDSKRNKKREEMLKIAPILNLDEIEFCRPITQQVETDHRFYGRCQDQTDDFASALQQVKTTFVGKFEPVKWKCRAPLKSGKLCPRMDRFKCPLHGKIVARTEMGEIVNESDKDSKNTLPEPIAPWLDLDLINDINMAAGKKVIENPDLKKKKKGKNKGKIKGNLTNITKMEDDSPRKRLERRLFTAKGLNKVGSILDTIEQRINSSKFHHQYNYSMTL